MLDVDVQNFFDSVDHDLMVKAVEANTDQKWVVLYVKRWLQAPLALPDGTLCERERGTPQGSAVSPVWSSPREPDTPTMGDDSPWKGVRWRNNKHKGRDASSPTSSNGTRWRSSVVLIGRSLRWPGSWGSMTRLWGTG